MISNSSNNSKHNNYDPLIFHQICTFLKETTTQWIDDQKVPYATKGKEWVGFDNKQSYETKVIIRYINIHSVSCQTC